MGYAPFVRPCFGGNYDCFAEYIPRPDVGLLTAHLMKATGVAFHPDGPPAVPSSCLTGCYPMQTHNDSHAAPTATLDFAAHKSRIHYEKSRFIAGNATV